MCGENVWLLRVFSLLLYFFLFTSIRLLIYQNFHVYWTLMSALCWGHNTVVWWPGLFLLVSGLSCGWKLQIPVSWIFRPIGTLVIFSSIAFLRPISSLQPRFSVPCVWVCVAFSVCEMLVCCLLVYTCVYWYISVGSVGFKYAKIRFICYMDGCVKRLILRLDSGKIYWWINWLAVWKMVGCQWLEEWSGHW